jgi:autotransporter-associated beta strand protein
MKINKRSNSNSLARRGLIRPVLLVNACFALLVVTVHTTHAGSATWNLNPTNGNWNTAANWTPATVPNGPADTATFQVSNTTGVSLSANTAVEGVVFDAGASAFTIATTPGRSLTISGSGITNNSGVMQNFVTAADNSTNRTQDILFTNSATAGNLTLFTNNGAGAEGRGRVLFFNSATAGNATFVNNAFPSAGVGGRTEFHDNSTAGNGSFTNVGGGYLGGTVEFYNSSNAGTATFTTGGEVSGGSSIQFDDTSSAANGTFTANAAPSNGLYGGVVFFYNSSTADHGTFTINGATAPGYAGAGGQLEFEDTSTASNATLIANGPTVAGGDGGEIKFVGSSAAENATIIVNGGEGVGGYCEFANSPTGGTARMEVFGNGTVAIYATDLTIGSIEGDGSVYLGAFTDFSVGSNNLSTIFSGIIDGFGSLLKIGTGTLELSGANTYSDNTVVSAGELVVNNTTGSGTSTGPVQVNGGTLGGSGIIAGATTIGTGSGPGAFLAPAAGSNVQATLTIQSALTFKADATYTYTFRAKRNRARTDKVIANGVTINSGAMIALSGQTQGALRQGLMLTLISNTSANPISGTFANLPDGGIVTINGNNFQASYSGGDGNDLTLTVVP